ncbi:MAG TPA: lysylphosphatidylglycerol synthase transmembrane domain-containing protein [Polyangia bacterium]|nr:lysylphosphatidylglycerol synthase transmembrane domain-containing protein [Polyangia bacterium]
MKFFWKILVSLLVGAACVWLTLRMIDLPATLTAIRQTTFSAVAVYLVTLAATHYFRATRWKYLLRPLGVSLPPARLLAASSVGFMGILLLPVRLGEFIRPYYVVRTGQSRMSAVLGTVAVERIVDGLVISILFFGCYLAADANTYEAPLRLAAWVSLCGFVGLTVFLTLALTWPDATVRTVLRFTLLAHLAPSLGARIADKLRALIEGFKVLHEPRDLLPFLAETILYWGSNGLGMWLLARGMGLDISLPAAYAAMAFTGVLISLPNSPGLVGQFEAGVILALRAYLPAEVLKSSGAAYAIALHGIQIVWYLSMGLLALLFVGGRATSLRQVVIESNRAAVEGGSGGQ